MVQAQDRTVSGTVTDAETEEPMPGVNVTVPGTTVGTSTDAAGEYSLTVPATADSLVFTFVGYQRATRALNGRTTINVSLRPSIEQLGEVVVTSFGIEQEQRALGYAVEEVSGAEIEETGEANLVGGLSGKIAGVQVRNTSGAAGGGQDIVIRGITSLSPSGNNQPLFVVDGIPVSNQTQTGNALPSEGSNAFEGSSGQFSFSNRAIDVPPSQIENISVLKGAAATALYGLRASNGAVVITTKKGEAGDTRVNFSSSVGVSEVNKTPDITNDFQFGRFNALPLSVFGFQFYQWGPPTSGQPIRNNTNQSYFDQFPGQPISNHFEDLFRTATSTDNSIAVSGGNETTTYYTSFSHTYREGIVPNTDWDRFSVKLRGTQAVSDEIELSGSLSFSNSGGNRPSGGDKSIMSSLAWWTPSNNVNDFEFPDGSQKNPSGFSSNLNSGFIDNPRFFAETSTLEDDVNRGLGHLALNYELTSWLTLDYRIGADIFNDTRKRFVPPVLDLGSQVNGFLTRENINYKEINSNAFLRLDRDLTEDLNLSFDLGNQVTDITQGRTLSRGEDFNLSRFQSLANTNQKFSEETDFRRRIIGLLGRARLSYDDTYFLTATARNDWASTLPEDNRSFFYPSVNLGYVFTEDFAFLENDVLSYGKLRFSWAEVGKDAPPFSVGQFFGQAPDFPFGGTGGFTKEPSAGDLDLEPEETTSFEVGGDLRFVNNRVQLDVNYFRESSKQQIVDFAVSQASGLDRFTSNNGEIVSTGWEIQASGTVLDRGDFSWDTSLNWSTTDSDVEELPEALDQITFGSAGFSGVSARVEEGDEVGTLYGFAYKRDDEGNLLIQDDGFPEIDDSEVQPVGNAFPDWQGGITNRISYKGISLSTLVEFNWGAEAYDVGSVNSILNGTIERTEIRNEEIIFDGVMENENGELVPNDQAVEIDETFWRSFQEAYGAAEMTVKDATTVRLRNVRLAYRLPQSLLSGVPVSNATFSVTGRNVFVATPFPGFDPEGQVFSAGSNVYGVTGLNIPPTRSISFQVNLRY